MDSLLHILEETLALIPPQGSIVVACSGGPDSIALLHSLYRLLIAQKKAPQLVCAHFNHRWNKASLKSVQLVERFSKELGVKFVLGQAKEEGRTSENQAREERYGFLRETARLNRAETVWLGHHCDDQLETFFLRLFRGTGPEGILGMRKLKRLQNGLVLVRPFLTYQKADLKRYCLEQKLFYYEDPSNQEIDIKRNYIRNKLIPIISRFEANYHTSITNFTSLLEAEHAFVEEHFKRLLPDNFENCRLFCKQPIALQRLILKSRLEEYGITPSCELIEGLRAKLLKKDAFKLTLTTNLYFMSDGMHFRLSGSLPPEKKNFEGVSLNLIPQTLTLPEIGLCKIEKVSKPYAKIPRHKNAWSIHADFSTLQDRELIWRPRLPGDLFHPLNARSETKLKSFLINRKVRQLLNSTGENQVSQEAVLLALGGSHKVLWIPGVEISDLIKVPKDGQSTHKISLINARKQTDFTQTLKFTEAR